MHAEQGQRHVNIRRAEPSDVHAVVELIRAWALEVFAREAEVTPEALLGDGFGSVLEFFVAEETTGELCGFAAWEKTYDVITGRRGGALLGQFIAPTTRGLGFGDRLLHAVANEVRAIGGAFLSGLGEAHHDLTAAASLVPPPLHVAGGATKKRSAADLSPHGEHMHFLSALRPET
ncbi:MAG TPA: GNAT family N-acetyltransferase [Polyangiaceae bacterium]|nr:GNAT family N-acetyltransferase [Polyangiaceae bacterium]